MADFVVATGIQPSEYKKLTYHERNAIVQAYNKRNKKK